MVPTVRGNRGKIRRSEKVREFDILKSGKNQRVRESQGKLKYQGAKVKKNEEEKFELLYADCVQWFKIFLLASLADCFYVHF